MSNKSSANDKIYNTKDQIIADFLKNRNLEKTNKKWKMPKPRHSLYGLFGKRILDICLSLPAVIILLPVYAIVSLCVFINLGSPIIYKQTRIGKNGKKFDMYKFRSMNEKKDANGELLPPNERLTKFGKFIRKVSLDELPEFINVLKGDMSIIGPRPLPVFFIDRMSERHKKRDAVKPGLECPYFTPEGTKLNPYQLKFENDIDYIENISFKKDIEMIFRLVKLTLNMKSRKSHAGALSYFMGYDDNCYAVGMTSVNEQYDVEKILKAEEV